MGIEPTSSAWEAEVLPLNYTREGRLAAASPLRWAGVRPWLYNGRVILTRFAVMYRDESAGGRPERR